ncbi:MAG TPA: LLM class flavin-dependent oxidoreductase [Candidatus Limnocylindrales bacterium]|nr:LLM class flavin-dependent oxidoreductase [Candidatus Limnocylindrales bacterium]
MATERTRLGLLVGANTLRNPALVSKMISTIDHASGGRAICGLGGAWFEVEHAHDGYEFGRSPGQRLDWLDEAVPAVRGLLDGEVVSSPPDGRYPLHDARHAPRPVQRHVPIMIGGGGEKKTLRTVAKYADMWNGMGTLEAMRRKVEVLRAHCAAVGRDPAEIEMTLGIKATIRDSQADAERVMREHLEHNRTPLDRIEGDDTFTWNGPPELLAEKLAPYLELGFRTVISEQLAPFDTETLDRLVGEVKPLLERG